MKKLNILVVHNYYQQPGGEGTVVSNEKKMLEDHGHDVFLYTRDNNEIKNYSIIDRILMPINYLYNLKTYKEVKEIIEEKKIDIVQVHNTINIISPSVYYASFKKNIPIVQTIHNFRLLCPNGLLYRNGSICEECINNGLKCAIKHKCYRNSFFQTLLSVFNMTIQRKLNLYKKLNYICLTEFNKKKLLNLKQIDENKIFIKPNFSNNNGSEMTDKRKKQIVFASRLDDNKGVKFLFDVWKEYGETAPQLLVFGSGELFDWCNDFIKDNNINNISMRGFCSNEEVKKEMKCSLATIICSELYEGFPMTIVESLSYGTPVISSDFGNHGSIIKDGINGYKYKLRDVDDCIKKIRRVISDNSIYQKSLNDFNEKYAEEANYNTLMEIYIKVLKKSKKK